MLAHSPSTRYTEVYIYSHTAVAEDHDGLQQQQHESRLPLSLNEHIKAFNWTGNCCDVVYSSIHSAQVKHNSVRNMPHSDSLEGDLPTRLPLLALLNEVLLPAAVAQDAAVISGGLVEHLASNAGSPILVAVVPVVAEKAELDDVEDDESIEGLHSMGTVAQVLQLGKMPQAGESTLVVEGISRIRVSDLKSYRDQKLYTVAVLQPNRVVKGKTSKVLRGGDSSQEDALSAKLMKEIRSLLRVLTQHAGGTAAGRVARALGAMPPDRAADAVIGVLAANFKDKLEALDAVDHVVRIKLALRLVKRAAETFKESVPHEHQNKLWPALRSNRMLLRRVGASGHHEDEEDDDITPLLKQLRENGGHDEVLRVGEREARRLQKLGEHHPGYAMIKSYLEVLADLPWEKLTQPVQHTLTETREILDSAHYGLDKIKERIVQHVAVERLRGEDSSSPILCFVGPPGVGKTSLAKSVADVLEKPFIRISLGGVRDEAEIRGHRKTYVGAMPGRILNGLRRAGVRDPVMLLDEVDKMGHDVRGDPSSALLEVLDPEQNPSFVDTYVGLPFDLSKVVFVATANRASEIPPPLLDRLEVIQLPGYTLYEKVMIGQRHLLPKVLQRHGLTGGFSDQDGDVVFSKGILDHLIMSYTREAGVRGLERCLAAICRYCAAGIVLENESQHVKSSKKELKLRESNEVDSSCMSGRVEVKAAGALGLPTFSQMPLASKGTTGSTAVVHDVGQSAVPRRFLVDQQLVELVLGTPKYNGSEALERIRGPGVAAGLVWSPVGGLVQYIECCCTHRGRGSDLGRLTLTGQLGDVLEESAMIALSWIRSNAENLGLVSRGPKDGFKQAGGSTWGLLDEKSHNPSSYAVNKRVDGIDLDSWDGALEGTKDVGLIPVFHWDIHVHLPSGGIPKDGPSAGVTIACALLSLFCGRTLRPDTAMTGELTLRGLVLPVGGVKEKCLAAHQAGMKQVLIPKQNVRDVEAEVAKEVQDNLQVVGVESLEDVLVCAFDPPFVLKKHSKL